MRGCYVDHHSAAAWDPRQRRQYSGWSSVDVLGGFPPAQAPGMVLLGLDLHRTWGELKPIPPMHA